MTRIDINKKLEGAFTAIITPFNEDESVDYGTLEKLIEFNIANGITGIVPCGTTGESPTLSMDEHKELIRFTVQTVAGRCYVIAGTGANCTKEAIELTIDAENSGADACLSVVPYYNKPSQEGMRRHFTAIAKSTSLPVILYNVPGRTSVGLEPWTISKIIESNRNVIGIKEASGDMYRIKQYVAQFPNYFSVLSGDDNVAPEVIKLGGQGVISVLSNIIPDKIKNMVDRELNAQKQGRTTSDDLDKLMDIPWLHNLSKAAFIESNPIPIKYMLAKQGMCKEIYRMPLCEMSIPHKEFVNQVMKEQNL